MANQDRHTVVFNHLKHLRIDTDNLHRSADLLLQQLGLDGPQLGDRRITKFWDCGRASWWWRLQLRTHSPHGIHHFWNTIATGDEAWALQNAHYFGIKAEEEVLD